MYLIDTHSHIYGEEFKEDREDVVKRALSVGVQTIILPDIDSVTRQMMIDLETQYPTVMKPCLGLHPTSVNENYLQELNLLEQRIGNYPCYAIGECGIDLYWDKTWQKEQIKVLEYQLNLAKDMHLPVIIHNRDALQITVDVLRKYPDVQGVLHCFCGNLEMAKEAIDMGYMLGIGGVVTFKNSGLDKILPEISLANIVLETDAPYLSPTPYRGKRNETANISIIAQKIADIYRKNIEEIAYITTKNAVNLFGLEKQSE